jgi:hypothetical protein
MGSLLKNQQLNRAIAKGRAWKGCLILLQTNSSKLALSKKNAKKRLTGEVVSLINF